MMAILKYPRTPHLEGSRLQPGDTDTDQVRLDTLGEGRLVFEEKVDGANCGVSFVSGRLVLQSRGHVLAGGAREAQFGLLKAWAQTHEAALWATLSDRFTLYGEWCFAKHSMFYDRLPHFLLEFDVLDKRNQCFLSTPARRALLAGMPVVSVPVLHEGRLSAKDMQKLIQPSLYKSPRWKEALAESAQAAGVDPAQAAKETDMSGLAEGLYVKQELGDAVIGRFKFVRASFLQAIVESGSHWSQRPIIANTLAPGVDIFASGA